MIAYKLLSLGGLVLFLLISWGLSVNRRVIHWRILIWGVALQFIFALLILKTNTGLYIFEIANKIMTKILFFTIEGAEFLFGKLSTDLSLGTAVGFQMLPTIIFVAALMSVLYYLRIIQALVWVMAKIMQWTMRASGAEALMAAMFVFMGIEATTAIKDYIRKMTRSEIFTLMTCFMATIAGSVMAAYVGFGASAGHLLAASVMSAPAAIAVAKLIVPETEEPLSEGEIKVDFRSDSINVIDAAASGSVDGLRLAATIGAMLLAFVALIGMADFLLAKFSIYFHLQQYIGTSFSELLGKLLSPIAFIMGVPWKDCKVVGHLLGLKIVANEFLAYMELQKYITAGTLSPRSITIATYALCSFANFGSLAILIGGIGGIAPEMRKDVARLGLRALAAGCIAGFMTATIAGILI